MISNQELLKLSEDTKKIFSEINDEEIVTTHNLLHSRIKNPQSYVTFVGETSSGKSTIINGLFSEKVLVTKASPTTGTVTQLIVRNKTTEQEFYAINKDNSFEKIDRKMFNHLIVKPDKNLLRLQTKLFHKNNRYKGLNLFDTPGYNSLIVEHEEVLRNFIPESDVIIHIVNYRIGFGEQDQFLLSSIYEQIESRNIPVLLIINQCPENCSQKSKRVKEIVQYANDTLHKKMDAILIPSVIQEDPDNPKDVFPQSVVLWDTISSVVDSDERKENLIQNSKKLLSMLLKKQRLNLEEKTKIQDLDVQEIKFLEKEMIEFGETKGKLFNILDTFVQRWEQSLPKLISQKIDNLIRFTKSEIQGDNKWLDSNACTAYIGGHHLPYGIRSLNKDVNNYFIVELEEMNRKMEDVANQAIKKLSHSINYMPSKSYEEIIKVLVSKIGMRLLGDTSKNLLVNLGGKGGVAAGMGNLVKMGVKRFGNVFGKTFSRKVYNNISRFFSKKMIVKINVAVSVAIEGIVYIYESNTWQKKLEENVVKELHILKKEACSEIIEDTIKSIKDANIETINELFDELNNDILFDINSMKNSTNQEEFIELKAKISKIKTIEDEIGEENEIK